MSLILGLFTFFLILISVFLVLVILAQRAKSDGGVGAALGGGMTEAAFGAQSGNVLTRATTYAAIGFFIVAFGLYLGHLYTHNQAKAQAPESLPATPDLIAVPEDTTTSAPLAEPEAPAISFAPKTEQATAEAAGEAAAKAAGEVQATTEAAGEATGNSAGAKNP